MTALYGSVFLKGSFFDNSYCGEIFTIELFMVPYSAFWSHFIVYRTRAKKGRSQLVAAPLTFQAKSIFLFLFYVAI